MTKVMFLSDDEMMVYAQGRISCLHSERRERYIQTARNLEARNAWKYEGAGAKFQMRENPYERQSVMAESQCHVRAIAPWQGRLLYALTTPDMGGLYVKDPADDAAPESSWLSERGLQVEDLHVQGDQVALSVKVGMGERHIAVMKADTARYEIITQGDTVDAAPFLSRDGRTLYYASVGLARNENGFLMGTGPSVLLRMNLRTGEMEEIAADDRYDYLRPKEGPDGALYCIRRPHRQPEAPRPGLVQRVKGFGAAMKGLGKLLRLIGDPQGEAAREGGASAQGGQAVQSRPFDDVWLKITPACGEDDQENGGIPSDWVLLRRTPGGFEEVCKGIADYDFDGDALVVSDGRRILRIADGEREVLYKGAYVPRIAVFE